MDEGCLVVGHYSMGGQGFRGGGRPARFWLECPFPSTRERGTAMLLKAIIDDQELSLEVPETLLREGQAFFAKLDADMDQGWQMSREWVARPNQIERCQIVADKLLTALEKENEKLGMLMAGYLLSRLPGIESVTPDTHGEMQNTLFTYHANASI